MARDLGEQEKAFVDALAADTGRDLTAWMMAIGASGHAARNDIIDWLRHQGFTFSNASWLERIHHNGGRLIYGGTDTRAVTVERAAPARTIKPQPAPETAPAAAPPVPQTVGATSAQVPQGTPPPVAAPPARVHEVEKELPAAPPPTAAPPQQPDPPSASDAELASLLMAAKGLRPLAGFVLREIDQLVPGLVRMSAAPFVTLASPMPFAALLPGPKELRVFGDFGPSSRDRTRKAETARYAAPFPDVIVLNDARQIDDRFRELLAAAYTRALK